MVPAFAQTTTSTTTTTTTSTSSTSTLPNGVNALYGANEFGTANAIANAEYPKGTSTAILASGLQANWVDSLTAAPLAAALKAPILLTSGVNTVGTETMAELTKLGVTKVILIGAVGDSVNAPKIEAELGSGITATTISGPTRFGTAGLVAQALAKIEGVTTFKTVFVASGEQGNLVDALAADPVAAEMGDPILLVPSTGDSSPIDANEDNYFNSATTGYLIGAAQGYLYNNAPSTLSLVPVYGKDRAGTAAAIDQEFAPKGGYKTLFITNGVNAHLVDALTAGPLMAMDNAAMAEVYSGTVPSSTTKLLASSIVSGVTSMDVVGGPASIPSSLYDSSSSTLVSALPSLGLSPKITVANANVGTGSADALTLSGVPSNATVTWSITSSNASTGLVSGTSTGATFVGTAPGTYTIQASVNGAVATATVTVYGQAAGVTLKPATSTVVADGEATDAVTLNVVDSAANTVADFNGTVEVNAVSGVSYWQNGTKLTVSNNEVPVTVTNGTATLNVGAVSVPGLSIAVTASDLTSSNGQSVVSSPAYGTTTITSAPQVATSLKIVNAPTYLDANAAGTYTPEISVEVEDQAGYPMLTGSDSVTVNVAGAGTLVGGTNNQETLAYNGFAAPAGTTNTSASFEVQSEQGVTGPITISASASGLTSATAAIQSVIAGVASQLSASLSANSFTEGSSGITLNLQAEDAQGAPVNYTSPVSVVVTKSGSTTAASNILVNGTAASSSTEVTLNSSGALAVTLADANSVADAGTYTVTISSVSGATYSFPTQTLTFTETAGSLAKASFTSPSTAINVPVTSPSAQYTLQLTDQYGNPIAQSGVTASVYALQVVNGTALSSPNGKLGEATVNGTVADSTTLAPVTVTTNAQGQATVTLAAEAFDSAEWELVGSVAQQANVSTGFQIKPSNTMTVSNQVPSSVGVTLEDMSSGSDHQSFGYAVSGDTVQASITMKDQYGIPLSGTTQNVELTIPAQFSGMEPNGASDSSAWVYGGSNTVTVPITLNSNGVGTVNLEAWTEGSGTLTAGVPGLTNSVSGSATMFVQPGPSTSVGLFYNGTLVSSANQLAVTANTPVELTVEPTDIAGNPVASTYTQVDMLMPQSSTGSFRATPDGASISTVTIPAGTSSVDVYYVNGVADSYVPETMLDAVSLGLSSPASVMNLSLGDTTTITANVYDPSGNFLSGQTVTAGITSGNGTLNTTSALSGSSAPSVTFTYTAPTTGSGTAVVTLTVPGTGMSSATLTQKVTITY